MLDGHTPGIAQFAQSRYGDGNAAAREIMARKYPTCALAHFEFDVDHWGEIAPGTGRLIDFIKVKDLQAVKIGPEPIAK